VEAVSANTRFRIRFTSDASINYEGVAFDDFHIYASAPIHSHAGNTMNRTATSNNSGNWVYINNADGHRIFGFRDNQNLGTVTASVQLHTGQERITGTNIYMNRNLVVNTSNAATQNVTVRFFVRHSEVASLINADAAVRSFHDIGMYKYSGPNENFTPDDNVVNIGSTQFIKPLLFIPYMDGYMVETTINGFSEFYFTESNFSPEDPLPLQVLSLTASKQKEGNLLHWSGQSTSPLMAYRVLRSTNGMHFETIHSAEINDKDERFYKNFSMNYTDPATNANRYNRFYYKIEMQEFSGRWTGSNVANVDVDLADKIILQPNPASEKVFVKFTGSNSRVQQLSITDLSGKVIWQHPMNLNDSTNVELSLKTLKPGFYLVNVQREDGVQALPLIVQ
jgi:hypothetical protein